MEVSWRMWQFEQKYSPLRVWLLLLKIMLDVRFALWNRWEFQPTGVLRFVQQQEVSS